MNKKKVLIIDDEIDIADNIKAILEDEGYEATISHDSSDAFNQISNNVFSLIILDVWLDNSELDGIGILKKLREVDSTPVIVISGHGNIDMAVKAIKDGANEFIEKPFTTERLLLSVNRSIELHEIKSENNRLKQKDIYDYELFSLKVTDSLYKKDIGKFLETLSSHFI